MNLSTSAEFLDRRRFVVLAPSHPAHVSKGGSEPLANSIRRGGQHQRLLHDAQRLRGNVYLSDGAIERGQLTSDGRHVQQADARSFHLLSLNDAGRVVACVRYLPHANNVHPSQLGVFSTPLAEDRTWAPMLENAVKLELARARRLGYGYVEMGGWAIAPELRCSTEAVRMVVTIYALARSLGGALGISTVTTRNCSSSILRRLGGSPLSSLTHGDMKYYDPHYKCDMEILHFDSDRPNEAFERAVQRSHQSLATVPMLLAEQEEPARLPFLGSLVGATA